MRKIPTPFLFRKAQEPTVRLAELEEPEFDLVSAAGGGQCHTMETGDDGGQHWCSRDDSCTK